MLPVRSTRSPTTMRKKGDEKLLDVGVPWFVAGGGSVIINSPREAAHSLYQHGDLSWTL